MVNASNHVVPRVLIQRDIHYRCYVGPSSQVCMEFISITSQSLRV